jgi:SRSO17 transposase
LDRAGVPAEYRTARTKPELALVEIDRAIAASVRFGCTLADAGYGLSAPFRQGLTARKLAWAVGIPRHLKVHPADVRMIWPVAKRGRPRQRHVPDILSIPAEDMLANNDGTFSREDFTFDKERNVYVCPAGKVLPTTGKVVNDGETLLYRASRRDCRTCLFKAQCCPKTPFRRIPRSIYEEARDVARALAKTEAFEQSCRDRKRIEMLFAHLKRILRLGRLRLRGPRGAQFEFTLAAIAQNLRRLAKLVARPPPIVPTTCVA